SAFEPAIAVDPGDPRRLAATWYQGFSASNAATAVSKNGGASWNATLVPGLSRCSGAAPEGDADPWISFGPDGVAYLSSIPLDTPVQPSSIFATAIAVTHSRDGLIWSAPAMVSPIGSDFNDKDSITADPSRPGV